ncbi:uncharacterized protein LOC112495000 [Cephus cinctus]|uniref:Uncharacterized protein LOC112495000 n=1 Tax=Cephus cinctus TaxID=211228 RepID=A0AAJ7W5Y1_CEPCN|nr:uncharacterized protein LOC112495000 [Cephus cinctus]
MWRHLHPGRPRDYSRTILQVLVRIEGWINHDSSGVCPSRSEGARLIGDVDALMMPETGLDCPVSGHCRFVRFYHNNTGFVIATALFRVSHTLRESAAPRT